MASKEFSFDVVCRVDGQELRNAVDQAKKELHNRWDFKGSVSTINLEGEHVDLVADDEFKLQQLRDIVESKLVKRGIDLRHADYGKVEPGTKLSVKQKLTMKQGIPQDQGKQIIRGIKDSGIRVSAQIQGEELRVTGKDKDELQKCIALVKSMELPFPVQFVNYR